MGVMFDEIWKLRRKEKKLSAAYFQEVERLRDQGASEEEIDMTMDDARNTLNQLQLDIDYAESDALLEKAAKLKVPRPPKNDEESWETFYGKGFLTQVGYDKLRSRIRQEKKERREYLTAIVKDLVVPISTIIISIISLLIAYTALKLKH
jgi:hypothetical protein